MMQIFNNIRNVPENLGRNMGISVPSLRTVAVAGGGAIATAATIGAGATIGAMVVNDFEHLPPSVYESILDVTGISAVFGSVAGVFVDKMINGNRYRGDNTSDADTVDSDTDTVATVLSEATHHLGDIQLQAQRRESV